MPTKAEVRILNGYRVILMPEHPRCMSGDWTGYVYEHIMVAEKYLERHLNDDEVVHHLDGNRANNRHENLLILTRGEHWKLHLWLESGVPYKKLCGENGLNSVKANAREPEYCLGCGLTLQDKQKKFCSEECSRNGSRKVKRPSPNQLSKDIKEMSMLAVGRKYGVSDNGVRKWIRAYQIAMLMPSQAEDESSEGVETTGEVNPLNNQI